MNNDVTSSLFHLLAIEVERISLDALVGLRGLLRTGGGAARLGAGLEVLERVDRAERALAVRRSGDDHDRTVACAREALLCAFSALERVEREPLVRPIAAGKRPVNAPLLASSFDVRS